jgi:putative aldouronate transport system permease protein
MDGASEWKILFQIVMPLSTPAIATVSLFGLLARWNDFFTSMLYIQNQKLYSLQYLLQKILSDAQFMKDNFAILPDSMKRLYMEMPTDSMKMALCLVVAGPMLVVFPFFQKYFAKGLTIGSLKG